MSRKSRPSAFAPQNAHKSRFEPRGASRDGGGSGGGGSSGGRLRVSLYGIHAVLAAIENPARHIHAIYAASDQIKAEITPVLDSARKVGLTRPVITSVTKEALDKSLAKDAVHQNIALDAKPLPEIDVVDILQELREGEKATFVMLDQVTDPHNIGAILRSACVFGARGVIVQSKHAPDVNGLIAKTACGAVEHVPLLYETNLTRCLEKLKQHGFFAVGLDERGQVDLHHGPRYGRTVLVLGAEGAGLRPLVRESCDILMKLATFGPISSLNVSNAAAVSLYALCDKDS